MSVELWCSDVGTGSPVLVVHGAGAHGPIWAEDLEPLTDAHRLIVPTRRGYPGSPPSPRDWSAHAEDMMSVLDSAGVESVDVVGHGAGCIVAVDLALRHAERVKRLVLLDPALRLRVLQRGSFKGVCSKMKLLRLVSEERAIETWFRYVLSYQPDPPSDRSGAKSAWTVMPQERREALRANVAGVFADLASGDGSGQVDDARLEKLEIPATVILGALSPVCCCGEGNYPAFTIRDAGREVISDAGHDLAFDQPDELLRIMRSAFKREFVRSDICASCGAHHAGPPGFRETVCADCIARAADFKGRPVAMYNPFFGGGFEACHRDDSSVCQQVTRGMRVLIDGKVFRADELRMGGIVVWPLRDPDE